MSFISPRYPWWLIAASYIFFKLLPDLCVLHIKTVVLYKISAEDESEFRRNIVPRTGHCLKGLKKSFSSFPILNHNYQFLSLQTFQPAQKKKKKRESAVVWLVQQYVQLPPTRKQNTHSKFTKQIHSRITLRHLNRTNRNTPANNPQRIPPVHWALDVPRPVTWTRVTQQLVPVIFRQATSHHIKPRICPYFPLSSVPWTWAQFTSSQCLLNTSLAERHTLFVC